MSGTATEQRTIDLMPMFIGVVSGTLIILEADFFPPTCHTSLLETHVCNVDLCYTMPVNKYSTSMFVLCDRNMNGHSPIPRTK